ncbi:hypothetical protein TGAM01_v205982 [Trichoderma gamsii]|uniref:F-box domain-containing protein n=1 Tax=Trichoderma gamsii TaxID=398673 RepID=A0A2P4ZLX4_9HYPO|nr:hypothetical protein TGAM01_v205982 [Trichoderma gamsii]PON25296.1 hypothetical protein TGAM01_v205982 [Trichoderma gamsii]
MAQPFPLMSLPEEIVQLVCRQLMKYGYLDSQALSFVCRASKALNRIATPVLYSYFNSREKMEKMASFLRSISLRPELGGYVQEIVFNRFYWFELTEDHLSIFADLATRLGIDLGGWLEEYPYEAMTQLIIAQIPNVKIMDVSTHEVCADEGIGAFTLLEQLAAQVPKRVSLSQLQQLAIGHSDIRRISVGYFGGIIELAPHIRELTISPCYGLYCDEEPKNTRVSLSNVTKLTIDGGHISKPQLESIVSLCGRLESFEFKHHTIYAGLEEISVTPRELIEILARHRHSLLSISVDLGQRERHKTDSFCFSGVCEDGDQILSLREFSRLETFKIDGTLILFPEITKPDYHTNILVNLLPRSIRHFQLIDAQYESVANMIRLMDSIADFPFLKEVTLTGNTADGRLGEDKVDFDKHELDTLYAMMERNEIMLGNDRYQAELNAY